jgi:predicted TIM-barrel fold metal-dependent hydrolase
VGRLLVALLLVACKTTPSAPPAKIDVHTHFGPMAVDRVVELMDRHGIDVAVNLSGGSPGRGLEQQLAAAARHPGRIAVFCNLDWRKARTGPGYGRRMAEDLVTAKRLGAVGLKIPKGLGLGYLDGAGQVIAVDDPELNPVFETAGELGMPVAIHAGDPIRLLEAADSRQRALRRAVGAPGVVVLRPGAAVVGGAVHPARAAHRPPSEDGLHLGALR